MSKSCSGKINKTRYDDPGKLMKQTSFTVKNLGGNDVNPVKNNETQQRKGTQDRSMDRFKWETSTRCL